jgi:osmotically-inducible protein OsmY
LEKQVFILKINIGGYMSNKISLFALTAFMAFANTSISANYQSSDGGTDTVGTYQKGSLINDQELNKRVQDKIKSSWHADSYKNVQAKVNDGAVTLIGFVPTLKDKENLEKAIRNIEGVKTVNSKITVNDTSTMPKREFNRDTFVTSADDQLNKKIRDQVSRGWIWDSYKNVVLHTSNGIVTLDGFINNLNDQQKLIKEVEKVEGVKSVKNNLQIKNR